MRKFDIFRRINGKDNTTALITIVSMSLAIAILSVLFFVRENNQLFFDEQARALIGCDMRIDIAGRKGTPALPSEEERRFLEELRAQGCVIEQVRLAQVMLPSPNGFDTYALKITDSGLPSINDCILSDVAAERLGLEPGDTFAPEGLDQTWTVLRVEPLMMTDYRINAMGIIVLHPDSTTALLESQSIGALDGLRLRVQITAPDGKTTELEEAVRAAFPYTPFSSGSDREVRAMNADEQLDEQMMVLVMVEMVLIVLALLSFLLSAAGILALSHLRATQSRNSHVLLRVQGMSRRDGVLFALYETLLFVLPSNLIGIFAGYTMFQAIIRQMTGIAPTFGLFNPVLLMTIVKNLLMSGLTMFLCLQWNYRRLFSGEIMDMRRDRSTGRSGRIGNVMYLLMSVLLFSLLSTGVLQIGVHDAVLPMTASMSFIMNLAVIAVFFLLLLLLFGMFRICTRLLRVLRLPLRGIGTLGYRLVLKRKTYTSLIGTALITGLTVLLVMYNLYSGIDGYFARIWQDVLGYSASAHSADGSSLQPMLDEEGFGYTTVYRKSFDATDMPDGTNAAPYYQVAVFNDAKGVGAGLHIEPGTFLATWHFLFCNQMKVGESYSFFDAARLKCTEEIPNLHTTGGLSTVTFSAALNYADAKAYVDDSYSEAYLFNLSEEEMQRLATLGQRHGFIVTTPKLYADGLRGAYANYVVLLYLICVLLGLTIVVFLFALTYVVVWTRRREFTIYRAFGASQRQVRAIILAENLFIAVIAALATSVMAGGLFKVGLELLTAQAVPYAMPIWVVGVAVLCAVLLLILISLGVVKVFQFSEPPQMLRADE